MLIDTVILKTIISDLFTESHFLLTENASRISLRQMIWKGYVMHPLKIACFQDGPAGGNTGTLSYSTRFYALLLQTTSAFQQIGLFVLANLLNLNLILV